jgi:hypothetical protein
LFTLKGGFVAESQSILGIVLTSSVIAGIVSAFVSTWTNQRKISIENITKERKDWREKVRTKSLEVHNALVGKKDDELKRLKVEFTLILNPEDSTDNYDKKIIECIKLPDDGKEIECSDEFLKQVSYLLKHDWERSKLEAGSLICRLKYLNKLCDSIFEKPKRLQ